MSLKRPHSPSPSTDSVKKRSTGPQVSNNGAPIENQISISAPIEDRSSTFIAHFCASPSTPPKTLQSTPALLTASHRILAWRLPSAQKTLSTTSNTTGAPPRKLETGYDDDGEAYAGKKLANLLDELDVVGSVCVARWYGGVLLGPVRFKHITDCAREAVGMWRAEMEARRQVEEDAKLHGRLVKVLGERDASVAVLRGLLKEKQASSRGEEIGKEAEGTPTKKTTVVVYKEMGVEALKKTEKARDATIAWLLKEIDKIEVLIGSMDLAVKIRDGAEKAP